MRLPPSLVIIFIIMHAESLVLFFMEAKEKNKMFYRPKPILKKKVIIFYSLSDFIFAFWFSYIQN